MLCAWACGMDMPQLHSSYYRKLAQLGLSFGKNTTHYCLDLAQGFHPHHSLDTALNTGHPDLGLPGLLLLFS